MTASPIERAIERFEAGDADQPFDHCAHTHIAWCYLERFALLDAVARFVAALRAFTKKHGAEAKYHETVTVAFMLLLADRRRPQEDWPTFRRRNADLIDAGLSALHRYYSPDLLTNDEARRHFTVPAAASIAQPPAGTAPPNRTRSDELRPHK